MTPNAGSPATDAYPSSAVPAWSEDPLTSRARAVWSAGDFLQIARSYAPEAKAFVQRLALRAGESVLDVACGAGNLAVPAAQAGARVTGVDIAPNLIAAARREAEAAGCAVSFDIGDAEALPYEDDAFDTSITMFGAMFAYRPERAAAELLRVTRSGGRLAMANWTPGSFVGQMLRVHTALVPPPAGVPSSLLWGDERVVAERLRPGVAALTCTTRTLEFHFPYAPAAVTELFATCYGPTVSVLKATDPAGASRLREELRQLFERHNAATDGTTVVTSEYLEVLARVA